MKENKLLADKYKEFLDMHPHKLPLWDDFFDYVNIPKKDRSNLTCARILEQVEKKYGPLCYNYVIINKGKNFISGNVGEDDKKLFFGPLNIGEEVFIEIQPRWCMAHILHHVGMFPSISQARKNGWNKPIPRGFTELTVGKKAKKQDIFILNIERR